MWCPSVSLSVWANAWLAGKAAPDDVLDALSQWAPRHSVAAYDSVAAGSTGLPWPDMHRRGDHVAAADAAHRGRKSHWRAHDLRRTARSRRCPRAPSGHPVRTRRGDRRRGDHRRRRPGIARGRPRARFRIRRRRALRRHRRCRVVRPELDGVFTARSTDRRTPRPRRGRVRAAVGGAVGGRCARCYPRRGRRVDVDDPRKTRRAGARIVRQAQGARPCPVTGAAGIGERGAHRRNRHGQFGF